MSALDGFDWYSDRLDRPGELIAGWRTHKTRLDEDSGRVTKVEQYRFMPEGYWPSFRNHLLQSKQFKIVTDTKAYPTIFNILLDAEGKVLNSKLKQPEWSSEYTYITHLARVVQHRSADCTFLLRGYQCMSNPNGKVKFEITYLEDNRQGEKSIRGLRNPLNKLAAMKEYKKRVDKFLGYMGVDLNSEYEDHTGGKKIEDYVEGLLSDAKLNDAAMYQRMLKFLATKKCKSYSDLF